MKIQLPMQNDSSNVRILDLESKSLVIIGANGTGKSKLGAWIEKKHESNSHRISAQRNLSFGDYISQMSHEKAVKLLITGAEAPVYKNHDQRWAWDGEQYGYTHTLLNDFEYALSAILALQNVEYEDYIKKCKKLESQGKPHEQVPEFVTDKLIRIWREIFPHRDIKIEDGKVMAVLKQGENEESYKGKLMSDGERVVLYLITQALCVPSERVIIIDEPEIHLHRSILCRLWDSIEAERSDCTFVYITHDLDFASERKNSVKLWLKNYDGANWDYDVINNYFLPEDLLYLILGNRKPVIFVEGRIDSYDAKLYSQIYKDYLIVPCGGCSEVITYTRAMSKNNLLHNLDCFGIIDKDNKSEYEIEELMKDKVYTLKLAEVENLFLIEEVLECICEILALEKVDVVSKIKKYIIKERFVNDISTQVFEQVIDELRYEIARFDFSSEPISDIHNRFCEFFEVYNIENHIEVRERAMRALLEKENLNQILVYYNKKNLVKSVGSYFGLSNSGYVDFIIRQLNSDKRDLIISAISPFLPDEIISC